METISAAVVAVLTTCDGVGLGRTLVGVRVGVGNPAVGVSVAGKAVVVGRIAVGVLVGVGAVTCRISNDRTTDQAPFVPLAVRPRTRHQYVRCVLSVWVV